MGGAERFLDFNALIHADDEVIDVMKVNHGYALNIVNFGFDTVVCDTMIKVKNRKLIGGKNAYTTGVIKAFFTGMKTDCQITVDGVPLNQNKMLLCTVANGQFVGGAFRCAPKASIRDGLLDVCLVDCLSHLRFMQLINSYKVGNHLCDPRFADVLHYVRGKRIEITSPDKNFAYCLDGEIIHSNHFTVEVLPHFIRFAIPKNTATYGNELSSRETEKV